MSTQKERKQFGLWPSPISPQRLARGLSFSDVAWNQDGALVWRETRAGQGVLVVQPADGSATRDLNSDYFVSAGVGYGGGDFTVGKGNVYFVEKESKRIYRQPLANAHGVAQPITPAFGAAASPRLSPDGRYVLFVHTYEGKDSLAVVDAQGENWPQKLISGDDFYMQPCWHPSGKQVAWITWNHPQMPWDGSVLRTGKVAYPGGRLPTIAEVSDVTGDRSTAIFQPQFSPDGHHLVYVSDKSAWWQLYAYDLSSSEHRQLTDVQAEHGLPAWVQGLRTYTFSPEGKSLYFIRNQEGNASLWRVEITSAEQSQLPLAGEYTWLEQIAGHPHFPRMALIASGGRTPSRVITFDVREGTRIWRRSSPEDIPPSYYTQPKAITWQGIDGRSVHGLFYAPQSENYAGIGKPPLLVLIHGGPTSQRGASFYADVQFFTTRGYAVLQVNYRGSSGYGREYRDALKGQWGIYDVEDSVSGARHLADQGLVDSGRMAIMGGSAGGFTVLKTLEDFPGVFKAGVCSYGIANQFELVTDTHKFEERYSESLLGPLPEAAEIYRERSPIFFADKIKDPVIIFQGEEDNVVPKNQSDAIVAALEQNRVPHEYHLYPGEGHGFRKPDTIEHFYTAVERFLRHHLLYA
jgi:dipeptidyl aminopeptidase/acylaminoacyl peptidase